MQEFTLADGRRLCGPDLDWEIEGEVTEDYQRVKLSRLRPGEQFVYVFDLGDHWAHLCTVAAQRIDPVEALGILPDTPLPYWGWGDIPDQYRRRWTATTASHSSPKTQGSLTFHRSGLTGARQLTAEAQVHSTVVAQASASLHPLGPAVPPRVPAQITQIRISSERFRQVPACVHNGGSSRACPLNAEHGL